MLLYLAQAVDESSGAYAAGRIVGIVVLVLIVALVIRSLVNKNK